MGLLEKTRKLNELLQAYDNVKISELAEVLSELEGATVYCADEQGLVMGYKQLPKYENEDKFVKIAGVKHLTEYYVRYLKNFVQTEIVEQKEDAEDGVKNSMIVPVYTHSVRLGTLVVDFYRKDIKNDDIILAEFASNALGAAILRAQAVQKEQMKMVTVAKASLSFTEKRAVKCIFSEMEGTDGYVVASKIADKYSITRSVIVNALRKMESSGVIETRSLGMKGTYIRINVPMLAEELEKDTI